MLGSTFKFAEEDVPDGSWQAILCVYKLYLFTYLLIDAARIVRNGRVPVCPSVRLSVRLYVHYFLVFLFLHFFSCRFRAVD